MATKDQNRGEIEAHELKQEVERSARVVPVSFLGSETERSPHLPGSATSLT
jgi:hypothetical protein